MSPTPFLNAAAAVLETATQFDDGYSHVSFGFTPETAHYTIYLHFEQDGERTCSSGSGSTLAEAMENARIAARAKRVTAPLFEQAA